MIVINRKDGDVLLFLLPNGEEIQVIIQKDRQESVRLLLEIPKSVKLTQITSGEKTVEDKFERKH